MSLFNPLANIPPAAQQFLATHKHWAYIVLAVVLVGGGGYATGRYLTPPNTITTEKIHETVKTVVVTQTQVQVQKVYIHDVQKDQKLHQTVVETTKPDGTKTKTTTIDNDTATKTHDDDKTQETKTVYVDRVVEKLVDKFVEKKVLTQPGWRVGAGVGISVPVLIMGQSQVGIPGLKGTVIQVEADRRVVGPFFIGLFGNSQGTVGLTLSGVL